MSAKTLKQLILPGLIGATLLSIPLVFQACSGSPLNFETAMSSTSPEPQTDTSGGVGRGDGYDGKPDPGTYYRVAPDTRCGTKLALYGQMVVDGDGIKAKLLDPTSCSPSEKLISFKQAEFNAYNRGWLGFEEGVFQRREQPPELNDLDPLLADAWCRLPTSNPDEGLDVIVTNRSAVSQASAMIVTGSKSSTGELRASRYDIGSVIRRTAGKEVRYEASGFILTINMGQAAGAKFSGVLRTNVGQLGGAEQTVLCRTSGVLDPLKEVAPLSCPAGYAPVPALAGYTIGDFCVAKFEAKKDTLKGTGKALSIAANQPWLMINRAEAYTACRENGPQFELISNDEWQTVARNIELVPTNWGGGAIGSVNGLNRGHTDDVPNRPLEASEDDDNGCFMTGQTCNGTTWDAERRTHSLSNGSVIWDLSGNAIEWVKDDNNVNWGPDSWFAIMTNNGGTHVAGIVDKFGPKGNYSHLSSRPYGNLGGLETGTAGAILRGGVYFWGSDAGIFTVSLTTPPSDRQTQVSFRCVYHP